MYGRRDDPCQRPSLELKTGNIPYQVAIVLGHHSARRSDIYIVYRTYEASVQFHLCDAVHPSARLPSVCQTELC